MQSLNSNQADQVSKDSISLINTEFTEGQDVYILEDEDHNGFTIRIDDVIGGDFDLFLAANEYKYSYNHTIPDPQKTMSLMKKVYGVLGIKETLKKYYYHISYDRNCSKEEFVVNLLLDIDTEFDTNMSSQLKSNPYDFYDEIVKKHNYTVTSLEVDEEEYFYFAFKLTS